MFVVLVPVCQKINLNDDAEISFHILTFVCCCIVA